MNPIKPSLFSTVVRYGVWSANGVHLQLESKFKYIPNYSCFLVPMGE